ncbi:MAG: nicotinate-nicotinamide nucleotide adenylyltransferase [Fervidobacterium sp.]
MEILFGLKELNLYSKNSSCVIFGGSFNPPHVGHIVVFSYALDYFNADFYVLPTKTPPHKSVDVSFEKRFEWVVKSFDKFRDYQKNPIFIWDLEKHIKGINYAIKNVEYIRNYYSNVIILVGEDALGNIEKWYMYEQLLSTTTFAIYPRTKDGSLYERGRKVLGRLYSNVLELTNFPVVEVSSSEIRERIKTGKNVIGLVDDSITNDVVNVYSKFGG